MLAELPDVSVAVHVTVVSPNGNTSGALLEIEGMSTRSLETGLLSATVFESVSYTHLTLPTILLV